MTARIRVWIYIAVLTLVAAGLAIVAFFSLDATRHPNVVGPLVVLSCLGILGYSIRQEHAGSRVTISFTMIILAAGIVLVGPFGATVVGTASALFAFAPERLQVRLFNSVLGGVVGAVGGWTYLAAGGMFPLERAEHAFDLVVHVGLPLMGANVLMSIANALLLGGVIRLNGGQDAVLRFALRMLATSGPSYVGYGLIAFLFVVLWKPGGVGAFSAVLVLAPLFVARWALGQYGDEQRVHERTIAALVAAVEANDPYTVGHSERMATLCGLVAERLSLGFQRADELRFAALLHDVGTIALPWQTLRHSGPLTQHDLDEIQQHPAVGVAMVQEIEFLQESCPGILHHHERFDGRGYPAGLAGEDIPEYARIIAVADAFDSMTTSRSYRPAMSVEQALAELRARAGSQFDPRIVSALEEALRGREWEPTVLSPAVLATAGDAHDHDDPVVSDLVASSPMTGHPLEHQDPA
jgi:HD-GYP domain-containing protein (c-di-GMP phosphodiesterase class II)